MQSDDVFCFFYADFGGKYWKMGGQIWEINQCFNHSWGTSFSVSRKHDQMILNMYEFRMGYLSKSADIENHVENICNSFNLLQLLEKNGMISGMEWTHFALFRWSKLNDQNSSFPSECYFRNWALRNKITILVYANVYTRHQKTGWFLKFLQFCLWKTN